MAGMGGSQDPVQSGTPAGGGGSAEAVNGSSWAGLLRSAASHLVPIVLTGASLVGFVAFAGAVIVWSRFSALEVPADQAVKAVPRDELVATGSSLLLIFGFFGVLALLAMYLVDRGGRATTGMSRALLALAAVECLTSIAVLSAKPPGEKVLPAILFALLVLAVLAVTFAESLVNRADTLPRRPGETLEPEDTAENLLGAAEEDLEEHAKSRLIFGVVVFFAYAVALLVAIVDLPLAWRVAGFLASGGLLLAAAFLPQLRGWLGRLRGRNSRRDPSPEDDDKKPAPPPITEGKRLATHRPYRFGLSSAGGFVATGLIALAVALPALLLRELWLAVSLFVAAALAFGLWRVACISKQNFMWFGLTVFLSVPMFGTLTLMARNLDDPQVQPMALIRATDGPDEAIQGLYVTEGDDRVYFANVSTEGCSGEVTDHSGRLLWVPRDEVVAMSIGPLQSVVDASRSALEMSYALTPTVETPGGTAVSLAEEDEDDGRVEDDGEGEEVAGGSGGEPAEVGAGASAEPSRRMESAGPAVRPNFGGGLSLSPEQASPGDTVVLRMSEANLENGVDGFGSARRGRTLRLGGVRVDIEKEPATRAEGAEWLETSNGQLLKLKKGGPFDEGGEPLPPDGAPQPRFVKLIDPSVKSVGAEVWDDSAEGIMLELETGEPPQLKVDGGKGEPAISFADDEDGAEVVYARRRPVSQAWHERQIRFRVPEEGATGPVTVECEQLAGQPLLQVTRTPTARIAVHMEAGAGGIRLDSRRSVDEEGSITARLWTVGGLPAGGDQQIVKRLPPRLRPYRVRLTVTDDDGETDTAEVRLLRLPRAFFEFGRDDPERPDVVRLLRETLSGLAEEEPPASIEINGYADEVGAPDDNLALSFRRAVNVRDLLLGGPASTSASAGALRPVPIVTRGFGETCSKDSDGGRQRRNRRVEVFILGEDTRVLAPRGCRPGRRVRSFW